MSKPAKRQPTSTVNYRQLEQELRAKIKDLELEVKTLKQKLDELRKAKSTTLVKKEKEFVTTGIPNRQTEEPSQSLDISEASRLKYEAKIEELNKQLQKLQIEKTANQKEAEKCGHEEIILALQSRLSEVESVNTALELQNSQLEERLEQAYHDISKKEAEHCEILEQSKRELQIKWQEMYKQWMSTTEGKIAELQAANDMMRRMLQQSAPDHS
ncbi:coiled-coil domain-containing protein 149-B-like [Watersipora subatra]|uniref:coiled-coil domain-containing protein 149-B-like n=1 Tax=Watersipora subatra TaxID=2589382 RepID=UPI00355B5AA6